jgi:hypothetical protein
MMVSRIYLALGLLALSISASAQVCPYGAYPGRLDEPQICRPPPDDTSHGVNESDAPQVRWEKTWGAIAMDAGASNGGIGTVVGKPSKRLAQKEAIEQCRATGGGAGCKVILSYRNQCAVLASGNTKVKAVSAPNIEEAKQFGIEECSAIDTGCKIYYSACSDPVRIQ